MSGAPGWGPAEARSPSFPLEFKPNGTQYLFLTGGPRVYIAFFGTGNTAVQSPFLCTVPFYRAVQSFFTPSYVLGCTVQVFFISQEEPEAK